MRTLYDRHDEIGFGKHRILSPVEIAANHPSYFVWLHSEKVVSFFDAKDQKWFNRRAGKIRRDLGAAGSMADMILSENGFDGHDDESELEELRGARPW